MKLLGRRLLRTGGAVDVWAGGRNIVRLEGVLREENVGDWLLPLIDEIHQHAVEVGFAEVVLDIRPLEYANAALWRCIASWVKRLRDDAGAKYNLRLVSDPTRAWQQIGAPTLRVFSLDARGTERLILEEARA